MSDLMPSSPAPKRRRRWRGWAIGVGATLTTLIVIAAVAIVSGVLLMSGPFGRELVRETLNGREIAGYGEVEIGSVSGNVLGRFEIDRIRVRDADGVWLEARDVTLAWSPWALRRYVLRVDAFTVREVTMSRTPVRAERPLPEEPFDLSRLPRIRVGEARIRAIRLAEGIAGPAAVYALSGEMRHDSGRWRGALDAQRTDAVGDRLLAEIDFADTLDLDARFDAPPGGLLSRLLDAQTQGSTGVITATGTLDAGSGDAEIYIGGELAVDGRLVWADREALASAQIRPDAWTRLARISELLGGTLNAEARAPLGRDGITAPDISGLTALIEAPHARLQLAMTGERIGQISLEAREALVALATNDAVLAEHLALDGVVDLSGDNPAFTGEIAGRAVTLPGGIRLGTVNGPISTTGPLDTPRINADLSVTGASYDVDALDRLIGQTPQLTADFTFVREDTSIVMHSYTARLPTGVFAGSGGVSVPDQRWRVEAQSNRARFNRLVDLIEGEGAIAINAAGDFAGALTFDARLDGFTPAGELAERLEAPLSATVSGRRDADGGLFLDAVTAEGPQFALQARGEQAGDDWRFNGDLAWSGTSPLAALTLEGALEAAFEAQYGPAGLDVRLDASAGALSAGPLGITGARLRVEAAGPLDALSGAGRLTGASDRGPVDVSAAFARDGETIRLSRLDGQLAAVRIDGSASVGPELIGADLVISPVSGFGEMSLQAELREGMIAIRAEAEDIVGEDLAYIDRFLLTLNGPLEAAVMRLEADGAYGAVFNAQAGGVLRLTGEPGAELTLNGRYGPFAIATLTPIEVQAGPVPSVDVALRIGDGELRARGSGGDAPSVTASLRSVPAGILSLRRARSPVIGADVIEVMLVVNTRHEFVEQAIHRLVGR
jgi:translocation and assembly module TamB